MIPKLRGMGSGTTAIITSMRVVVVIVAVMMKMILVMMAIMMTDMRALQHEAAIRGGTH